MTNSREHKEVGSKDIRSSFGVGCFHFGYKNFEEERGLFPASYSSELKSFLEKIPGVHDIDIPESPSYKIPEEIPNSEVESLNNEIGIYPWPCTWEIKFSIEIQKEKINTLVTSVFAEEFTKKYCIFDVVIIYHYGLPVAFVESKNEKLKHPSSGIIAVRKYISDNQPKNSDIHFQILGPSPFHADFYFTKQQDNEPNISTQSGYDDIYFPVPKNLSSEEFEDFKEFTFIRIAHELSIYYEITQSRNFHATWLEEIDTDVREQIDSIPQTTSWRSILLSLLSPPKFDEISIEIIEFELSINKTLSSKKIEYDRIKSEERTETFKKYIEDKFRSTSLLETQKIREILSISEKHEKSISSFKNLITATAFGITAAVLGGATGAIITLMSQ